MELPVFILIFSFLFLLLLGMPIAWVLATSSFFYLFLKPDILPCVLPQRIVVMLDSFILCAVPFFLLTAEIMNTGKITDRIFSFANSLIGHFRGGLGYVNILASVIFAGMSGSMLADVMGLGKVEVKAMLDAGYDRKFTAAVTAASATIGPIIPPSVVLVIYGYLSEVSISRLLIGGIIPGLVIAAYEMVVVFFLAKKRNYPVSSTGFSLKKVTTNFKEAWLALLTPLIIVGGIGLGVVTPTEAAVVAAVYAILLALFVYRTIRSWTSFKKTFIISALGTAKVVIICATAAGFGWILTWERLPHAIMKFVLTAHLAPWQFLLLFNLIVIMLGCFIEGTALIIILTPMILPLIETLGIDPIHFGVMFILNIMIGTLTPPFGLGLFALSSIAKVNIYELSKELIPFTTVLIIALLMISFFPNIVLFLPNLIFGTP